MSCWRLSTSKLFRQALIKCTSRSYAPSLSRSHHNAAHPRASLLTSLSKRGAITTSKSSATAFLFVSLAGCVFWIAESNSRSSSGGFGERLTISELRTESDNQDDGFILKEMPFPERTPFVYPSLTQDNKTRLLILEPGSFNDELKCKVEPVDRLEDHNYEALSYFWGERPGTITELSTGKPIHITANCEAALRRLRYENDTRLLWVDAICINQPDKSELSKQVEIMPEIYTSADKVIVWLGEGLARDSLALETLDRLRSRVNTGLDLRSLVRLGWYRDKKSGKVFSGGADTSVLHENEYEHLINLLLRPWFRRTWVIQEVASAKDATVICGGQSIEWELLADVYMRLGDNFLPIDQFGGEDARHALEIISAMENARRSQSGPLSMPLFHILVATSFSECKDPRDRIFAVKGLAKDWADQRGLETNYKADVETLFKAFAVADANRNLNLRTLSCASGPGNSKHPKLPSWVPDWESIDNAHPFVRYSDRTKFCASGGMKAEAWHSRDRNIFCVKGKSIDSVAMLGIEPSKISLTAAVFEIDSQKIAELEDSLRWLQECEELASKRDRFLTAERQEELWRTLTCGLTGDGFPAPKHYSGYFKRYMKFMANAPTRFADYLQEAQTSPPGIRSVTEAPRSEKHGLIEASLSRWSSQRSFCVTRTGALACVPKTSRNGDVICVLFGGEVPYVLRPTGTGSFWVIGECYVHGIMHGESLSHDAEVTEFRLV
ncbi:heterokaryon incompatibility protein-domain-containing protein [Hyaloscypha finlandica]|nr:heterokaryon incompatibility protein-domain-containing protein [Hyaloscypha finlandica]